MEMLLHWQLLIFITYIYIYIYPHIYSDHFIVAYDQNIKFAGGGGGGGGGKPSKRRQKPLHPLNETLLGTCE